MRYVKEMLSSCTLNELINLYHLEGWDESMSFTDYKSKMTRSGVKILPERKPKRKTGINVIAP